MNQKTLTLRNAWEEGKRILRKSDIEEADLDAWYLLECITGIGKASYYVEPDRELSKEKADLYLENVKKRAKRIPLQHITGEQEFMGLSFKVNQHVLIPRQDTETLVECGLGKLKPGMKVLDLCTGSGCIIISMAVMGKKSGKLEENTRLCGADISLEALEIAKENARRNHVSVKFTQSDLFQNIDGKYDMIISNPPYIPTAVIQELSDEVKLHDPFIALDGKEDGLYFYRQIVKEGKTLLSDGGYLLFEIGHDQGEAVSKIMEENGFTQIEVKKDLAGLDRVVLGLYNKG